MGAGGGGAFEVTLLLGLGVFLDREGVQYFRWKIIYYSRPRRQLSDLLGSVCWLLRGLDVLYRGRRSKSSCFLVVLSMVSLYQVVRMGNRG